MHEMSLAQGVLRRCAAHLGDPPGRIARVRLAVGELSAVEPDLLRFAWEAVTTGGPHAGARLDIEWRMARQRCAACDLAPERAAGAWSPSCPRCDGPLHIEGGQELDVLEMEFIPASVVVAGGAQT
jgi:hydrogenase nickel incorporation protein HypA/HybF